ncbi:hypothetical protein E2C01_049689 [Portunus trituberculatus]|uniref:Uncharacterized protein n=1 Tax=Portunus trituberculatus TaxID=210409 RepID=A0A5B7GEC7_PORTR|nr:hypothetical protein [Portunus trituberculatus]
MAERMWFMWQWKHGHSIRNIAKQTRRSPTTVRKWVKRLQKEEHQVTKAVNDKFMVPFVSYAMTNLMSHNIHVEYFHPMHLNRPVSNEHFRSIGFSPQFSSSLGNSLSSFI